MDHQEAHHSHHQHTPTCPPRQQMPSFCHGDSPPRQMPSFCHGDSPPKQMPSFCQGDSPPRQMPSFCQGDSWRSQPVIDEAFKTAQSFLGELFGQPGCPSCDAAAPKRGESEEKPSSQRSGKGNCCRKTPTAPSCPKSTSGEAQKPACQEKKTGSEPPAQSVQKTEEQHAAGKSASSHPQETTSAQWSHSLYFSGLTPDKVSVKAKKGKVFIRAFQEKLRGPSSGLSKVEVTRTVTLPEDVDHKTLTCTMKQDGTLVLRAYLKDSHAVKKEADKTEKDTNPERDEKEMSNAGNQPEKEQATTNMPEKTEASTDQQQNVTSAAEQKSEMHALENETENLKALENKFEGMQALKDRSENTYGLENKAEDLHILENKTEEDYAELCGEFQNSAGKNDGSTGELDDITAEEQYQHSGDEAEMTNMEWNHTTFPLIEESDDESLSIGEDISEPSSMDFVVIDQQQNVTSAAEQKSDSVNTEKAEAGNDHGKNKEDIQTSEGQQQDQALTTEEAVREQTYEEISTPDKTDPPIPIKRTNSPEPTHDTNEGFSSTLGEHSHATTLAANPQQGGPFQAALPLVGFSPGNVQVKLHGHTLRITAKRQAWLGEAPYTESVEKELELPGRLDVLTVRCVYQQENGCLLISADPESPQREVPVMVQ
ncbi:hypothetical protein ACOMHN_018111 [Nucella lapillus]